eukprot:308744_1
MFEKVAVLTPQNLPQKFEPKASPASAAAMLRYALNRNIVTFPPNRGWRSPVAGMSRRRRINNLRRNRPRHNTDFRRRRHKKGITKKGSSATNRSSIGVR